MSRAAAFQHPIRVLRLPLKDKHARALIAMCRQVNFVLNYSNELAVRVFERERRFLSGFDFNPYMRGASKEGWASVQLCSRKSPSSTSSSAAKA